MPAPDTVDVRCGYPAGYLRGEPMSRYGRSIRIGAPPADVWAAIVDVETWPRWASQFKRLERLDVGPLAPGTRVRVTPRGMPGAVWKVTDYEEGHSFTWASSLAPGVHLTGGHVITPDGNDTNAQFWLESSGVLGTLLAPLLRRTVFSRNTRSATEGLKIHMERGGDASVPSH